jgi:hypothetical protein
MQKYTRLATRLAVVAVVLIAIAPIAHAASWIGAPRPSSEVVSTFTLVVLAISYALGL